MSGKTTFVLRGIHPETGTLILSAAVTAAEAREIPMIDEDYLINLLGDYSYSQPPEENNPPATAENEPPATVATNTTPTTTTTTTAH